MQKDENMAQRPNAKPITPKRETTRKKHIETIKEKLKTSKFNNPHNWPVYTKYLPKNNPRYTGS
jgi:hypothetical protein